MAGRKRRNRLPEPTTVVIEGMSHEGRGIAHIDGKTVFVFGALIGEKVKIQIRTFRIACLIQLYCTNF